MRMELHGQEVRFYVDRSSPCCGENRSEWELIGTTKVEHLVKALERLVRGERKVDYV